VINNTISVDALHLGMAAFNNESYVKESGALNALLAAIVLILLGGGAAQLNKNTHTLVVVPFKRMIAQVERLQRDPLRRNYRNQAAEVLGLMRRERDNAS
jgi:hypothetical protein